ncbi:hypothetical protein BGW38_007207 [Lunasporangiospora selenospora]|uniref:Major facilitator superfamily (MFS) profile domain-containing protein n=1 Tax=Lunasporangiospora selenospora TaxID=979761 RepID=A0A9P6KG11_9FUNG|nr:hypothetical protein BGW38_007207 [Lunasporangiospora selenospora]
MSMCLGVTFCWGVFQDFFIRNNTFPGVSAQDLSWTGSVSCATIFAGAPMVVVVVNRVGTVPIMVTGIFCVTLGFIGGSFALELWHLLLTIGFLYGFGGCVLYFTSLQVLSQYFVRRRAFVVGVAISGSGIGATTTAPLLRLILAKVGFRWAMRIFGGCMFVLLTMAACFIRPRRLPAFARPVQQQTLNHSLAQAANPNTAYGGPWRDAAASTMDSDYLDTGRHSRFERSISSIDLDSGHANSRPSPASASTLPESASPPSDDPNPGLDFGIFTVIPFTLVFIATNIFALVYLIPFLLAPSYATLIGLSPAQGASLVSICSAVGIVSRLAVGQLADRTGVLNWSIITSLLTGVSCLAFWLNARSYGALVAFMVLYGAFAGSTIMLLPVAATRAVSPDRMSSALGFVLFAHSIGYLFGTPFAQWIIAMQDGSYWGATTLVAAMNFVCGGILIFTRILTERRFWAVA